MIEKNKRPVHERFESKQALEESLEAAREAADLFILIQEQTFQLIRKKMKGQ